MCHYRGAAPAMQDLLGGQVNMIRQHPGALAQVRAGKVARARRHSKERTHLCARRPRDRRDPARFDINSWTTLPVRPSCRPMSTARLSEPSKKALESDDPRPSSSNLAATAIWRTAADTLAFRGRREARLAPDRQGVGRTSRLRPHSPHSPPPS